MAQFFRSVADPGSLASPAATAAYRRREASAARCLDSARHALSSLGRGGHVFGLTKGQFSMIDLAAAALDHTGPGDVGLWTWCIASYEVEAISGLLRDGRILSLRMVMDWAGAQRDMPIVGDLQARFGDDCVRVTKTHAKIMTISTACGWRVVIRGSMNLNANPRFEQFDASDDPGVFGVVSGVVDELWRVGRPVPIRRLKHSDAVALLDGEAPVRGAGVADEGWMPGRSGWWR